MNRYQLMDEFIKKMASILRENNDKVIPFEDINELVHTNLVKIGTKHKDADLSFDGNNTFNRLKSYFEDYRNIEVNIDPRNNYFIQLQNKPEEHINNIETIKLYIPQDTINMERSARELFEYLSSSNISHISRISKNERFDDIVVQVTNWNDADKIIKFARGNRQIKYGMLEPNPFIFNVDGIGISTSRGGSINNVITSLLSTYLNDKVINDKLNESSLLDFIDYSEKYYKHHFVDLNDIGEVVTDFDLKGCENSSSENNKKIANVGSLVDLFVKGLDPKFNLDSFKEFYLENSNDGKLIGVANAMGLLRNYKNNVNGSHFVGSIDSLLLESVDTFKEKYHIDDEHALKIVDEYIHGGNIQKITRDNDIRKKYVKGDFANKLNKLMNLSGLDLVRYYYNKKNSRAVRSLRDAVFETYIKYEDRYEQGFEQTDGYEKATYALKNLIKNNDARAFTRDNNARKNLIKYGNKQVAIEDMGYAQGHEVDMTSDKLIDEACKNYVSKVIDENILDKGNAYTMK